ncbi:hypothetical protein [Gloeomargarita sp.]
MNEWWQQLHDVVVATLREWEAACQDWSEQLAAWDAQLDQTLWEWEAPLAETAAWVEGALIALLQPLAQTLDPLVMDQPACVGCKHYHGQVYNGQIFVCAMHPYGVGSETCPDWEALWS